MSSIQGGFQKKLAFILNLAIAFYCLVIAYYLAFGPLWWKGKIWFETKSLILLVFVFIVAAIVKIALIYKPSGSASLIAGISPFIVLWLNRFLTLFLIVTGYVVISLVISGALVATFPFHIRIDNISRLIGVTFLLVLVRLYIPFYYPIRDSLVNAGFKAADFVQSHPIHLGLFATITFLLFLRLWNLAHGLEYNIIHIDAGRIVDGIYDFLAGKYDRANTYPLFGMRPVEWAINISAWINKAIFNEIPKIDFGYVALWARYMNVVYSVIMAVSVYLTASLLGRRDAGLFAAFLVTVSTTHNQMTKYISADMPMATFAALSIYFMTRNLNEEKTWHYIVAAIFFAMSTMSKYNGILTIFFIAAVYLKLHPGKEAFRHLRYIGLSAIVAYTVVLAGYPVFLTDGAEQLYVLTHKEYGTSRGVTMDHGILGGGKLGAFFYNYEYNFWVLKGIIAPLPALLFLVGAIFAFRNKVFTIFIVAPLLMFAFAKIFKPNAASYHLMNTIPLFAIATGVGLLDAIKLIGHRWLKASLITALVVALGWWQIQDNSFWGPKTNVETTTRWINNNVSEPNNALTHLIQPHHKVANPDHNAKYFVHAQNGQPWAYTLFRNLHEYVVLREGKVLLEPMGKFLSNEEKTRLFTDTKEIAVTDYAFETRGKRDFLFLPKTTVSRDIFAPGMGDTVALYIVNLESLSNKVFGAVGCERFEYTLKPLETKTHIVKNPNRTLLYRGAYVNVSVGSDNRAIWKIAVTGDDLGDFFLFQGKRKEAIGHYQESYTAYGALNALILEKNRKEKRKIVEKLKSIYPPLFNSESPHSWSGLAGYTDQFFLGKLSRDLDPPNSKNGVETSGGWKIGEKGVLYGPYINLDKGNYTYSAYLDLSSGVKGFMFDISASFGQRQIMKKRFTKKEITDGRLIVNFAIDRPVDGNIEFRFYDVTGGSLTLRNAGIAIDHLGGAKSLYEKAKKEL